MSIRVASKDTALLVTHMQDILGRLPLMAPVKPKTTAVDTTQLSTSATTPGQQAEEFTSLNSNYNHTDQTSTPLPSSVELTTSNKRGRPPSSDEGSSDGTKKRREDAENASIHSVDDDDDDHSKDIPSENEIDGRSSELSFFTEDIDDSDDNVDDD